MDKFNDKCFSEILTPGSVCVFYMQQQPWPYWVRLKAHLWSSLTFFVPFFLALSSFLDERAWRAHRIQGTGVTRDLYNMFVFEN